MLDAERPGQRCRIRETVLRRISRRHCHGEHVLGSERIHRKARGQRRVDAAGEPEDHVGKTALARVVAQPEHECPVGRFLVRSAHVPQDRRHGGVLARQRHIVDDEVLGEIVRADDLPSFHVEAD